PSASAVAAVDAPTRFTCCPGSSMAPNRMGVRAAVTVQTMSAPRTASSRLAAARILMRSLCRATKAAALSALRPQTTTSAMSRTRLKHRARHAEHRREQQLEPQMTRQPEGGIVGIKADELDAEA